MQHVHHGSAGSLGSAGITLALVLAALVYLRGWQHLRATKGREVPAWRFVSFFLGLFLIWVAVASRLATLDEQSLTAHMIQHLFLMTLAPPLIWLGEPVQVVLTGLPEGISHKILHAFQGTALQRVWSAVTRLSFCLAISTAALVGWHIPVLFALGMQSQAWHALEQSSFLVTGLLFWWPVIQPWPSIPRHDLSIVLYLFLATLPCDILSAFLVFCDRVVYPMYFSASQSFGLTALEDQQCAGALMWTCVTVVYLVAGAILTMRLLSPHSHRPRGFAS